MSRLKELRNVTIWRNVTYMNEKNDYTQKIAIRIEKTRSSFMNFKLNYTLSIRIQSFCMFWRRVA